MKYFSFETTSIKRVFQVSARGLLTYACGFLILAMSNPMLSNTPRDQPSAVRFARGQRGMVATGSPEATAAALRILSSGGNAIDAAAAAHLALMVTDPANTSLGGRTQILLSLKDGKVIAIDGATRSPATIPRLKRNEDRKGFAVAPVPGNLAALDEMVRKYGRLKLADVLQPSIELAENGFRVTPRLAAAWSRAREALLENAGAAQNFLKPDGSAYKAGEVFVQPRLTRVLRRIADSGVDAFYRGDIADEIARDFKRHAGFVRKHDLANYRPIDGVVVRTNYRGYQVAAAGGRAWGDTLIEMLNIMEQFSINSPASTAEEVEITARVIAQAFEDRPQEIGTLKPKKNGYSLATLSSRQFADNRAALIKRMIQSSQPPAESNAQPDEHDTTHLSVMDAEGNAVALTTSIGPSFGSRVATPELGFLYAHSYRMRADPQPETRDETEMTPTIVFEAAKPMMVIGAAGSERIPSAILQVISNVVDRSYSLEQAISAPRLLALGRNLRMQSGFSSSIIETLSSRGFKIESLASDSSVHLGLVHAVRFDRATKEYFGAVDPGSDGAAGGP
jgi:gamma-glutamyltranspeptidase / glutathione hydrolase